MHSKKTLHTLLTGALALGICGLAANNAQAMGPGEGKEKCYGIAKKGMNDCASADGAHGCAASAKEDASGVEWIGVPTGLCNRIVGGSLEPITTPIEASAEAPAAE